MDRHVEQMSGVRHEAAQPTAMAKCALRMRRHFHQMNLHVQQARMAPRTVKGVERTFQDRYGFQRVGPRRRLPCLQIPQGLRRTVHDRFCEQCRDIQIAGICLMHAAHRIDVGVVP